MSENTQSTVDNDPRNQQKFAFHTTLVRRLFIGSCRLIFRLITQQEIIGVENLPPEGSVVMASNHLTNFDVFLIQFCMSRPLFFMAKAELYKNIWVGALLRQLGAFPVQRGAHDEWALNHARKVLDQNQVLAMFPEGSRSKGRGLRPAKTGAARFALYANCPILPVAVSGTEKMFSQFPKRTRVTVQIGELLYPEEGENALALTDRLMFTLAEILPPELRGVYAERPTGFD